MMRQWAVPSQLEEVCGGGMGARYHPLVMRRLPPTPASRPHPNHTAPHRTLCCSGHRRGPGAQVRHHTRRRGQLALHAAQAPRCVLRGGALRRQALGRSSTLHACQGRGNSTRTHARHGRGNSLVNVREGTAGKPPYLDKC